MRKIVFLFFIIININVSQAQKRDPIYDLLLNRDYIKCIEKCEKAIEKNPDNLYAYFYKSICLFEMDKTPAKYEEYEKIPIYKSLMTLSELRKRPGGQDFIKAHMDTLSEIKIYAEELAEEYKTTIKSKSVKLYRFLMNAFRGGEFNKLMQIEVYFMAGEISTGYLEIDKIFNLLPANAGQANIEKEDYDAMMGGPTMLIKYYMFSNTCDLIDKYLPKFENNPEVNQSFLNAVNYAIDTLYKEKEKKMFLDYSLKFLRLFPKNEDLKLKLKLLMMEIVNNSEAEFSSKTERTWKDTVLLQEAFKYSFIGYNMLGFDDFKKRELELMKKYKLQITGEKLLLFKKNAIDVFRRIRAKACECTSGNMIAVDSLIWNDELAAVALEHAKDMFRFNYSDHNDRSNRSPQDRVNQQTSLEAFKINTLSGVMFTGAMKVAENIANGINMSGVKSEADLRAVIKRVFDKWLNSSEAGVCETVMSYEHTHFGLAVFGDRWVLLVAEIVQITDH